MQLDNVFVVAKREYLQRARSKAFWVTTLILPVFVAAVSVVPSILMAKSKTQQKIVVVDETGKVGTDLVAKMNAQQAPPPADKTGTDKAGDDTKVLAVPVDKLSNLYGSVESARDLPDATLAQISHFFAHYKDLEAGKWVKVAGWVGAEDAKKEIMDGVARYKKARRKPRF